MKTDKNKLYFRVIVTLCMAAAINTLHASESNKKSLYGNSIYNGKNTPNLSFPEWSAFFVTSENCKTDITSDGLLVKVSKNGGTAGYTLSSAEFNPTADRFSVEHKSAVRSDSAGITFDVRWGIGKRVSFSVLNNCIIDAIHGDTLKKNMSNSHFAHYRCKVDGATAKIYKDSLELADLSTSRTDIIPNPGFENNSFDPIMWSSSTWAKREMNANTAHVNSGKYSLKFSNGANGKFFGTFNVQPNSKYRLTFYAKVSAPESLIYSMQGGLFLNNVKVVNLPIASTNFSKYTAEFTTGPADNTMQMILHNGFTISKRCVMYFDDFELTQIEGAPYLQFGKLSNANAADFTVGHIAYLAEASNPVTFSDYKLLLSKAAKYISEAVIGTETGEYPQYAADKLTSEIKYAEQLPTAGVSFSTIDSAYYFLDKSYTFFVNSKIAAGDIKLASIQAGTESAKIKRMHSTQINVTGLLTDGTEAVFIPEQITYNIIGDPIISINASGLMRGNEIGSSKVEVVVQRNEIVLRDTISIEVIDYQMSSIKFSSYENKIAVGEATGTILDIVMNDGTAPEEKLSTVKYNIITPDVIEMNEYGAIIAKKAGKGKIEVTVSVFGKELTDSLEINCYETSDIVLNIPRLDLNVGDKDNYTLKVHYSDGTDADINNTNSVVISENPGIVTVDDRGNLLAVAEGKATIRFEVRLKTAILKQTQTITVTKEYNSMKMQKGEKINIYPNPAVGTVTVEFEKGIYNQLKVLDTTGIEVLSRNITDSSFETLQLDGLKGNYLIQLSSNTQFNIEKIIINKP